MSSHTQEYFKTYYKKNEAKRRSNTRIYNQRLRNAIFELLGSKCIYCGFEDKRALQIDHINGGGSKDKKTAKGFYYKRVLTEIMEGKILYQILCANCNWIKRHDKNETVLIK